MPPSPRISVVIATYNRTASVVRLLGELAQQTLPVSEFEVIVVDDGSTPPAASSFAALDLPFIFHAISQVNGGPAVARDTGIQRSSAPVILSLDDDMSVAPGFLEQHLQAHREDERIAVLGRVLVPPGAAQLPLFERFQVSVIERLVEAARDPGFRLAGTCLYSGNVSFRRDDYFRVGGFDPSLRLSEDAELGIRLDLAGVRLRISEAAWSHHHSDHSSVQAWFRRSRAYGAADARVAAKHPDVADADPWRFLFQISRLTRPLMLGAALFPGFGSLLSRTAMPVATLVGALGLERIAIAGATFAYGAQYFAGLGEFFASRRGTLHALRKHLNKSEPTKLGFVGRLAKCAADIRADHDAMVASDDKYQVPGQPRRPSLVADAFRRIGFQMMIAYRIMRFFVHARLRPLAMLSSRLIRHLYGADIHWDAEFAPGVVIVHGMGLVVSGDSKVAAHCILFQRVTLGRSLHSASQIVGAPSLEAHVHVGPGATLLGPITIGRATKIVANSVVMESVTANSLVEPASATVRTRTLRSVINE